jgi:NOL1/NOP2/fmu family ribosome biogenesis protein
VISLNTEQAQAYAEYKDLKLTEEDEKLENGFYLLSFQNTGYSLTKKTAEMIKNKML